MVGWRPARLPRSTDPGQNCAVIASVGPTLPARDSEGTTLAASRPGNGGPALILLTLYGKAEKTVTLELTDLRVSGGVLWSHLDHGLIANYCENSWKHRGRCYSRVSVAGGCCLLFGISREPTLLSEPLELFSFSGSTFHAAGIAVARYNEQQDMWQGLVRPIWWAAMRIVSAGAVSALVDPAKVEILNPWEPSDERGEVVALHRAVDAEIARDSNVREFPSAKRGS